jgi:hypothetical protein
MEIAQRAEADLKALLGLAGIRNRLTIAEIATPASQSTERARFDLRYPVLDALSTTTVSANAALASRLGGVPAEPTFSWRPVTARRSGTAFPIPFVPEGLGRPPETRDPIRETAAGDRENLRIGKVDTLATPDVNRQDSDIFVLPAIDLRHGEAKPEPARPETRSTAVPLHLFLGI